MCRALGSTSSTKPLNNRVMCLVVLFLFFLFVVVLFLLLFWVYLWPGMVVHIALENQKQADLCALETTLVSIVSSRLIKAIQ